MFKFINKIKCINDNIYNNNVQYKSNCFKKIILNYDLKNHNYNKSLKSTNQKYHQNIKINFL